MMPREKWTEERLDDLNKKVDDLKMEMREGFARVDADIRALNARFDALNRNLLVVAGAIIAALIGTNVF
jgi:tetrahydromethanopterin S-methyltransferase subunit G